MVSEGRIGALELLLLWHTVLIVQSVPPSEWWPIWMPSAFFLYLLTPIEALEILHSSKR